MPYIPPPPRPPAPPVFRPPPAPVFRPPAQNLHFQQQQRFQQQQHFQQQQRFQQQQQFQQQQRHQENIRRIHQNIQMENQRRQQLHQQQLQRQQQQQQFQRQQEEFRRQQQEQQRRQQQEHFRRLEQQRQQDLLRNFQRSTAIGGNTVVHVAPGFTLEVSGVGQGDVGLSNGEGGVEVTANGTHLRTEGVTPSREATGSGLQQSPTFIPQATPTTSVEAPVGQPPPYPGGPLTTPPPSSQPTQPSPQAQALPSKAPPTGTSQQPDNRIVLKDGTQVILHQEDEILFIGPTGIQMVVNCLPLYDPPDEYARAEAVDGQGKQTASQGGGKSTLIKARSMESISSSQLGDEDTDSKAVGVVATPPRRKASKFSHYSVTIHDKPVNSDTQPSVQSEGVTARTESECEEKEEGESKSNVVLKVELATQSSAAVDDREELGESSEEVRQKPDAKLKSEQREHIRLQKARSVRTSLSPDVEGSDSEDNGFSVQYIQDPYVVPQLKRSSGSVSFYHPPSPGEMGDQKAKASSFTHSPREDTLLERSCEDKLDDDSLERTSEENGATVVSGKGEGEVDGVVSEVEEKRDEENKEEKEGVRSVEKKEGEVVNSEEKKAEKEAVNGKEASEEGEKEEEEGASGEGEITSREKSLSTVKPPLVEETQTILDQSAAESPSAPNQSSSPPSLSATIPPPSPGATPQAPPPSNDLVLPATPLPATAVTLDKDYVERSGWMNKLSHRKGVFGDKWQKRYFVLHRSWLYYFKKYGDSNPRGVIRLLPTGWCKLVPQGSRRMSDAVINKSEQTTAVVSVLRCLAVHRPNNFAASLSALLGTEGIAEAFRSQTVSVSNAQHSSRTFYMIAASNEERDNWITSINNNIKAYAYSPEALDTACKELKKMLRAVQSNVAQKDIPAILLLLTLKMRSLIGQQESCTSSTLPN